MDEDNPMVGGNVLTLNAATMMKAMEYWLNECVFMCDCGVAVKSVQSSDNTPSSTFKVTFEPPKVEKK